ncbi:MAG: M48 family metallopeptidase [Iphinoe sp. HA4291-MV1]|jgi:hypothetical protein|nr:M48 family metallopeptidase [Iphinoe sp. HA4291-MV1]
MTRKILTELKSGAYEHPFDRKALASLEKMPGISLLFKKINEYGVDRLLRIQCTGNDIQVTSRNFPELHSAFVETCQILDVTPLPKLYLFRGTGNIQTYTVGVENPYVGINLEGMEWLSYQEWLFLFGHELAHIKSRHLLYHQVAYVLPLLGNLLASTTLGFGGLATHGIQLALSNWLIMARFTADRAGLLACQDTAIATTALMKLSGLPNNEYLTPTVIDDFLTQARNFNTDGLDKFDKFTKMLSFMEYRYSSWAVMRTSELLKWVESGDYEKVLEGDIPVHQAEISEVLSNESSEQSSENWNFLSSW